jgi:hypothetical protein
MDVMDATTITEMPGDGAILDTLGCDEKRKKRGKMGKVGKSRMGGYYVQQQLSVHNPSIECRKKRMKKRPLLGNQYTSLEHGGKERKKK